MIPRISIKTALIFGLFFSLLLPISFVTWYTTVVSHKNLYEQFSRFQEDITRDIAEAMAEPLFFFAPNDGGLILKTIKQDDRIVKILVEDTVNTITFIDIYIPERDVGNLHTTTKEISKNGEVLGTVSITFNDIKLQTMLQEQRSFYLKVFGVTFFTLLLCLYPLVYYKILFPLKQLNDQASDLRKGNFSKPIRWDGDDEINTLGKSFEKARANIEELVSELQHVSITDRLTGLYNRHHLDQVLHEEKARAIRYKSSFGAIILDVDHFKSVNDTHGHGIGDTVLIQFAALLLENCRANDTVGRWGGEEFLIICPEATADSLERICEKLRKIIETCPIEPIGSITASFGASMYNKGDDIKSLIGRADRALYDAKKAGRNRTIII